MSSISRSKKILALVLALALGAILIVPNLIAGLADTATDPTTYIEIQHENDNAEAKTVTSYWQIIGNRIYQFAAGDKLEYDIWLSHKVPMLGGPEVYADGTAMRNSTVTHPDQFTIAATETWESVSVDIQPVVQGKAEGTYAQLAYCANEAVFPAETTVTARITNIRVTNGGAVKFVFFDAEHTAILDAPPVKEGSASPDVDTTFRVVGAPDGPETFIEATHTNANATDTSFAGYYQIVDPKTMVFAPGDRLEYDLYVSHNISGLGGFEIEVNNNLQGENMRGTGNYHPKSFKADAAGQWQRVTTILPSAILPPAGGNGAPMRLMYALDTALLPAETTVTVRIANLRIVNGTTVKWQCFGSGATTIKNPVPAIHGGDTAGITSDFRTEVSPEGYVTVTHANTNASDTAMASYWTLGVNKEDYKFVDGDRLVYDVWSSHKLKGFGGFDMDKANGYNNQTMRGHADAKDEDGVGAHPQYFQVKDAEVWQTRSVGVGSGLTSAGATGDVRLLCAVEGTIPASTTVTLKFANIRIMNGTTVKYTFLDKDYVNLEEAPQLEVGSPAAGVNTSFDIPEPSGEGTTAPTTAKPTVPEDDQLVKVDGVKDDRYSDVNSIDIVDAYGDGGVNPTENFDDVTGKVWYTWDDNFMYFYTEVKDSEIKTYTAPNPPPATEEAQAEEDLRRLMMDTIEMYLDPDPTNNVDAHFDVNCKQSGCAEMRFNVMGGDLSVWNASQKNERIYDEEYCKPFKTADGYGFEMKWERVPGEASFRFNMAIQNSSDPHYAVAIGKAWWTSYEASVEVFFSDDPSPTLPSGNETGTTTRPTDAAVTTASDTTPNVNTGVAAPYRALFAFTVAGGLATLLIVWSAKRRRA